MSKPNIKIKESKKVSRKDVLFCLSLHPGCEQVTVGSSDAGLYAIDLAAEKPEALKYEGDGHTSYVTGLARAGNRLISSAYDRHLIWWDTETRKLVKKIKAHDKWIRNVVASPDQSLVASVGDDMVCRLWKSETGDLVHELRGHEVQTPNHYPSMLFTCAFSPDGKHLATADKVGHIVVWDVASGAQIKTMEAPTMYTWDPKARRHSIGGIRALTFSPDGKQLVAGGIGKIGNIDHLSGQARMRIFNWEKAESLAEIESSEIKGMIERLIYHPDGDWMLALGGDHKGFALVVDTKEKKIVSEEKTPANHVHDFAMNETSDKIYVAAHNHVTVHDLVPG